MDNKEKQKFMSDHYIRIKRLQNSDDPYKHVLINQLAIEYDNVKRSL